MAGTHDSIVLRHDLAYRLVSLAHAAMLLLFAAPGWVVLRDIATTDPNWLADQLPIVLLIAVWGLTMLVLAAWWLIFVWTFAIRADDAGISQGWALRREFVVWNQIATVDIEPSQSQPQDAPAVRPRLTLRDAQGRWLMQVWLGHGTAAQKERFIQFVTKRVPAGTATGSPTGTDADAVEVRLSRLSRALMVLWLGMMGLAYPTHAIFKTPLRPNAAMDSSPVFSWTLSGVLLLAAILLWWKLSRTVIRADSSGVTLQTGSAHDSFTWQQIVALWEEMPGDWQTRQFLPYLVSAAPDRKVRGWCEFSLSLAYPRETDRLLQLLLRRIKQQSLTAPAVFADPQTFAPFAFRHPRWHGWMCIGVFGVFGVLLLFWPLYLHPARPFGLTEWVIAYTVLGGCGLLFAYIGIWGWWDAHTYRLHVDAKGIMERRGRKTTVIHWDEVASYSMEPLRKPNGKRREILAPVLKDAHGHDLLQVHPEVGSLRERNLLQRFIEAKIGEQRQ